MTDIDFHSFDQQIPGEYAEIQSIQPKQSASSKTVQIGNSVFTVTMLPQSQWFWKRNEAGILSLGTPEERIIFKAGIPFKNKKDLNQLLHAPQLLQSTLEFVNWIDFKHLRKNHLAALNELKAIYENPQTPLILREYIQKYQVPELLSNPELLTSVLGFVESIDDSHLKSEDISVMKYLEAVVRAPSTPSAIRKMVLRKVYAIYKTAINRTIECAYGIPQKVMRQTQGEGSYDIIYAQPDKTLEQELRKNCDLSILSALDAARNQVAEAFEQRHLLSNYHTKPHSSVRVYSDLIVKVLANKKYNKKMSNKAILQELNTCGKRIADLLIQQLSTYTKNGTTLRQDLQNFEKRMRAFENKLLQALVHVPNGQYNQLNVQEHDGFLYCDFHLGSITTLFPTNTLVVVDTHLNRPLAKKSIYEIQEELTFLQKKFEGYLNNYKHGKIQLKRPSEYTKKAAQHTVKYITELVNDYLPQLHQETKKRLGKWEQLNIDHSVLEAFGIPSKASYRSRMPGLNMIHKISETRSNLMTELNQCLKLAEQIRTDLNLPEITPNTHTKSAEFAR